VGTSVTITGNNFSATAANNIVFFGAVKANIIGATTTQLLVTVPAGATYQPITVTTNNLTAYSHMPFVVTFASGGFALSSNSMAPKTDYTSGSLPVDIFLSDFDGDGKVDMANINAFSHSISVFKNNSTGANISFTPGNSYPTGSFPLDITSGDLDGDGKPDLAVANDSSNTVSLYRNTSSLGNISFAPGTELTTGIGPLAVAIVDLDVDGKPDMIIANSTSSNFSVFRNTSTPGILSFATKTDFPAGFNIQSLAFSDIDGDAKPDLVFANGNANTVSVFRNTSTPGSFSFAAKTDYNSPYPIWVSIGDIDGDGQSDIITTSAINPIISVLRNTTSGGFFSFGPATYFSIATICYAVSISDIDGDGKPDLCATNSTATSFSILRNTSVSGLLSFDTKVNYTVDASPFAIAAGDLDGDGKPDIATANYPANSISVLRNTVSSLNIYSFSPAATGTDSTVTIIGSGFSGATAVSFGGMPAASFTVVSPTIITAIVGAGSTGNISITTPIGTVLHEGFTYVPQPVINAFTPATAGTGFIIKITGSNFTGATAVSFGGSPAASFIVDSATSITAVVGAGASGNVSVITAGGTATKTGFTYVPSPVISSFSPSNAAAGATVTIIGSNFTGATSVYFGEIPATSFVVVSPTVITAVVGSATGGSIKVTTPYGYSLLPGFYNGIKINSVTPLSGPIGTTVSITGTNFSNIIADNKVYLGDVSAPIIAAGAASLTVTVPIGASFKPITVTTNKVVAYANNAFDVTFPGNDSGFTANSFDPKIEIQTGANPYNFCITDFDGDGKPDLAVPTVGALSVHRNTGSIGNISFTPKSDYTTSTLYILNVSVSSGDLDGDGKPDLILSADYSSKFFFFRNTSSPGVVSFEPAGMFATGGSSHERVSVMDFDGDGKVDLAVPNEVNNKLLIYRNTTNAQVISFSEPIIYATGEEPQSITVGDFDSDGKQDIAVSNFIDSISVYKNTSNYGSISFAAPLNYIVARALGQIGTGDLDGDGKPDLIIASHMDSTLSILRNTSSAGSISFANKVNLVTGNNPYSFSVGDMDGDGKPDIVIDNIISLSISILKNNSTSGTISFSPKFDYPIFLLTPVSVSIGDLDGDGKPDFGVAGVNDHILSIYRNNIGPVLSPSITSFTPGTGTNGDTIRIKGIHFTGATSVNFGGYAAASFTVVSDTIITAVVGAGSSGSVVVITPIGVASRAGFEFISLPKITSFTPTSAATGATITIIGTNFTGATSVSFGGIAATSFTVNSATSITAVVGAGTSGNVSVTTPGGTASIVGFTFIPPPTITSFTPVSGGTGTSILITGNNFTGATAVNFGGVAASYFSVNSATSITALVGPGASGNISVTTPGGTASIAGFTFNTVTGINGPSNNNTIELRVFPNPTSDIAIVKHPSSNKNAQIKVVDIAGRTVEVFIPIRNTRQSQLDLKILPGGIYNLIWSDGTRILSRTLIIK